MDSEEEEDDGSMELNPVSEKESDNEQDCSSIANDDAEGDNSMNSNELGGTTSYSATPQSISCNNPEVYSESDVQSAISCGDFGRVVQIKTQVNLTDHQKFFLLKKHFVPSSNHKFPTRMISNIPRHFQHSWLKSNPGLVYSESENGGYCKYCVLFGKCEPTVKQMGVFVMRPFTNFKKASELLGNHFHGIGIRNSKGYKTHQNAVQDANMFIKAMEDSSARIENQLSTLHSKKVAENRLKLRSIAETIILCGRQSIAFQGHRDDRSSVEENPTSNHGNFLALLQFRVQAGDKVLSDHLQSAPANATYTSKTIQNELIVICGDLIRNKILERIRQACYFSVLADEATDISNDEQLSISIRYVDEGSPKEVFVEFHKCTTGVTGQAIADDILLNLKNWQLQLEFLRGQAYDGAGAMAGKSKGAAACIVAKQPKALYTHCASHRLNLCVVKCCSIREISNMMQSADKVSHFFSNSPKRQLALEKWIDDLFTHERQKKLKEMCRTRWIERHKAFESFLDLFMPIVCCLEEVANSSPAEWNAETRSDAQSLFLTVFRFSFVVALVFTQKILSYIKGVSVKLQGRYVDIARAHTEIENVKSTLYKLRSDVERFHTQTYNQVLVLCQSVGIEESTPRITNRQQHRQNLPSSNSSEYFKRTTTIPLLDHLISELSTRFDESSSHFLLQFVKLLPSEIIKHPSRFTQAEFDDLLKFYEDDLPSSRAFTAELDLWQHYWCSERCMAIAENLNTPEKVLKNMEKDLYPNIHVLLVLAATVPVTSCECERSFSMLRLIKTSLRSTMTQERLNGLAMIQYNHHIPLEADEVVEEFAIRHPRKLLL